MSIRFSLFQSSSLSFSLSPPTLSFAQKHTQSHNQTLPHTARGLHTFVYSLFILSCLSADTQSCKYTFSGAQTHAAGCWSSARAPAPPVLEGIKAFWQRFQLVLMSWITRFHLTNILMILSNHIHQRVNNLKNILQWRKEVIIGGF